MFTRWKKVISDTLNDLFNKNILVDQVYWENLKYNIRKYTINFSRKLEKNTNKKFVDLETNSSNLKNIMKTMLIT